MQPYQSYLKKREIEVIEKPESANPDLEHIIHCLQNSTDQSKFKTGCLNLRKTLQKIEKKDALSLLGFYQDKLLPLLLSVLQSSFPMHQYPRTSLESLHTLAVISKLMDDRLRKRSVKSGIIQTLHKLTMPIEKNNVTQACKEIAQKVLLSLG